MYTCRNCRGSNFKSSCWIFSVQFWPIIPSCIPASSFCFLPLCAWNLQYPDPQGNRLSVLRPIFCFLCLLFFPRNLLAFWRSGYIWFIHPVVLLPAIHWSTVCWGLLYSICQRILCRFLNYGVLFCFLWKICATFLGFYVLFCRNILDFFVLYAKIKAKSGLLFANQKKECRRVQNDLHKL